MGELCEEVESAGTGSLSEPKENGDRHLLMDVEILSRCCGWWKDCIRIGREETTTGRSWKCRWGLCNNYLWMQWGMDSRVIRGHQMSTLRCPDDVFKHCHDCNYKEFKKTEIVILKNVKSRSTINEGNALLKLKKNSSGQKMFIDLEAKLPPSDAPACRQRNAWRPTHGEQPSQTQRWRSPTCRRSPGTGGQGSGSWLPSATSSAKQPGDRCHPGRRGRTGSTRSRPRHTRRRHAQDSGWSPERGRKSQEASRGTGAAAGRRWCTWAAHVLWSLQRGRK